MKYFITLIFFSLFSISSFSQFNSQEQSKNAEKSYNRINEVFQKKYKQTSDITLSECQWYQGQMEQRSFKNSLLGLVSYAIIAGVVASPETDMEEKITTSVLVGIIGTSFSIAAINQKLRASKARKAESWLNK